MTAMFYPFSLHNDTDPNNPRFLGSLEKGYQA